MTAARSFGRPLDDYGKAWASARDGRCCRLVYSHQGQPQRCAADPSGAGWRSFSGRWVPLDACTIHQAQLAARPRRPAAT